MSDIKCPFCQTELEINDLDVQLLGCENQKCKHSAHYDNVGTKELWQALIQAKRDSEILKVALNNAKQTLFFCWDVHDSYVAKCAMEEIDEALKQIEHKDDK